MFRSRTRIIFGFSVFLISGMALAHSGATGVVKQRMDAMKDIGSQMKIIGEMLKGNTEFDKSLVQKSALIISRHGGEIAKLFPHGSAKSPSEALPSIWDDWENFVAIADQLKASGENLSVSVQNTSSAVEIAPEFASISKTCSNCHEKYRLKK